MLRTNAIKEKCRGTVGRPSRNERVGSQGRRAATGTGSRRRFVQIEDCVPLPSVEIRHEPAAIGETREKQA